MSIYNLDKIFNPASVAVVGASEREHTVGYALLNNIIEGGYPGKLYPINPGHREMCGLATYPSIKDVGEHVDLVVIATPISTIPAIIKESAEAEVQGAIIISAGGKEIGDRGLEIEAEIKREADRGHIRVIGPNCVGVLTSGSKLFASFADGRPLPGKLAFISQSGALCTAILDRSLRERTGFSHFVSVGDMLDVDFGDLIDYFGDDPEVSSIVMYIESVNNTRKFMSAARAVSRIKPIVVLKSGRSAAGAKMAASHTGAIAGVDTVYDAAFKRAGIVRVDTIEELFDCAELLAKQPVPRGPGLSIITNAGGPGVMAADALSLLGLEPVSLSEETLAKLDDFLPPFWNRTNPVDILGDASPERYRRAVEVCVSAPEVDGLVVIFVPQAISDAAEVAASLVEVLKDRPYPVFAVWMGGEGVDKGRQIFNQAGIPTYETPERAIEAFMYIHSYARNLESLQQLPPKLPRALNFDTSRARGIIRYALRSSETLLTEVESKALFSAYGIPVNRTEVAGSQEEAASMADDMGYPVAMKIYSRDIVHKTDANGIQLNLHNRKEVEEAFTRVMEDVAAYAPDARLSGVTIQPMMKRPDYELILGSKMDNIFGPVVLFGMGGIMTEVLKDQAIALPPLNRLLARNLIESTRVYQLLKGYRNRPPANLKLLEEILVSLSQLVTDFPEIVELDINPLFLTKDDACAVDARVILRTSDVRSPMHLVISPYPNQYETNLIVRKGVEVFIRPIKPEDGPLLLELFNSLSKRSIMFRFLSPIRQLSSKMLARFTQLDYDRDMALVAMPAAHPEEKILGVARLMADPDLEEAEFAVVVADDWQDKGMGAALMEQLIVVAKEMGIKTLWGLALPENKQMIALARELGFDVVESAEDKLLRISATLSA